MMGDCVDYLGNEHVRAIEWLDVLPDNTAGQPVPESVGRAVAAIVAIVGKIVSGTAPEQDWTLKTGPAELREWLAATDENSVAISLCEKGAPVGVCYLAIDSVFFSRLFLAFLGFPATTQADRSHTGLSGSQLKFAANIAASVAGQLGDIRGWTASVVEINRLSQLKRPDHPIGRFHECKVFDGPELLQQRMTILVQDSSLGDNPAPRQGEQAPARDTKSVIMPTLGNLALTAKVLVRLPDMRLGALRALSPGDVIDVDVSFLENAVLNINGASSFRGKVGQLGSAYSMKISGRVEPKRRPKNESTGATR